MINYNLELDKAIEEIKKRKAKRVCIQLPEGLKEKALMIAKILEEKTKAEIFIWADTCFGPCDVPKLEDVDLIIQWGHRKLK